MDSLHFVNQSLFQVKERTPQIIWWPIFFLLDFQESSMGLMQRIFNTSLFLGGGFILLLSYFLTPDPRGFGTHQQLFLPPCPFRWLTHLPCPSCGLTTSFAYFAKGDWIAAWKTHPLGPILFIFLVLFELFVLKSLLQGSSLRENLKKIFTLPLAVYLIIGVIMQWIFRLWFMKFQLG